MMLPSNRRERNTLCHRVMPGRRSGDRPIMRAKRPPGNIQRPAGLKIARFRKRPFRPGHTRLALTSEQGESKLLFRPRNKRLVAARTHGPRLFVPFQLPLPRMRPRAPEAFPLYPPSSGNSLLGPRYLTSKGR